MKTLIFVHGGESFTNDADYQRFLQETYVLWQSEAWTPEIKTSWVQEIAKKWSENGKRVFMPVFPNKQNARYNEWKIVFGGILSKLNREDEVTLVGGSLGGCFLLKYFSEVTDFSYRVNQIHLLAACISAWDFTAPENYERLQKLENRVHIWHAEDDAVVPSSVGKELSHTLSDAQTHFFSSEKWYWHFHGIASIPELEEVLFS